MPGDSTLLPHQGASALRARLAPARTVTCPSQAGIAARLAGETVAKTLVLPGRRASRMALLPWPASKIVHSAARMPESAMCTSVASPWCHRGTMTTTAWPADTVMAGIGCVSVRVREGTPGLGAHDVPAGLAVTGTLAAGAVRGAAVTPEQAVVPDAIMTTTTARQEMRLLRPA
jgi:hypothetical protein